MKVKNKPGPTRVAEPARRDNRDGRTLASGGPGTVVEEVPVKAAPASRVELPAEGKQDATPKNATGKPVRGRRFWRGVLLGALILIALGGFGAYFLLPEKEENASLVLQGNIDVRQVNLSFKVDGRIDKLMVDEGDPVKAGQVIARLDKRYFEDDLRLLQARRDSAAATLARLEHGSRPEEIAQARAQLDQRKATLARARQDYARAGRLLQSNAMSREDFDQLKAAQEVADANVGYAEQALRLAEIGPRQEDIDNARAQLREQDAAIVQSRRRLDDSLLVAPNDGFILTRAREEGAIVQAGETVFTLTLASPVWVRTYVNETDLGLIQPDMPASVVTDTAPDHPYAGRIGFISPTAEFTPKTVETRALRTDLVYRLRVVVDNPDGGLRQGMPVTVDVQVTRPRHLTLWERLVHALSFGRSGDGR